METVSSLRQTVTHLFDAVRYSDHVNELREAANVVDAKLEVDLAKLESHTEDVAHVISTMKGESADALKDLSRQVEEFLATAKEQAEEKIRRTAKAEAQDLRSSAESEKDKALKSLEAFLSSDPLPIVDGTVRVKLGDGFYEATSRYECEGGIKYDFRLAAQTSKLFHEDFTLSQLGYELKVPVRFSRAILKKERVPGYERLDQYVLADAETSSGKIRANFQRGTEATLKVVTSGPGEADFVGLEYSDHADKVNVMNDPALIPYVDLPSVRKASAELITGMTELANKKVALTKFSLNGEESMDDLDYRKVLETVLFVLGPSYKSIIEGLSKAQKEPPSENALTVGFIKERLKVLGDMAGLVSKSLGI